MSARKLLMAGLSVGLLAACGDDGVVVVVETAKMQAVHGGTSQACTIQGRVTNAHQDVVRRLRFRLAYADESGASRDFLAGSSYRIDEVAADGEQSFDLLATSVALWGVREPSEKLDVETAKCDELLDLEITLKNAECRAASLTAAQCAESISLRVE